jgi:CTD small phosphatase-like protein 2
MISILEGFSATMKMSQDTEMNDAYKIGGTAFEEDSQEPLEVVEPPYLPPLKKNQNKYTLVLDLDETLVHYFEIGDQGKFLVRPGVASFLKEMNKFYEIVIFTAAVQDYADWALNQIDPDGLIKYRLYRHHALP